jgi:hypothetical protein
MLAPDELLRLVSAASGNPSEPGPEGERSAKRNCWAHQRRQSDVISAARVTLSKLHQDKPPQALRLLNVSSPRQLPDVVTPSGFVLRYRCKLWAALLSLYRLAKQKRFIISRDFLERDAAAHNAYVELSAEKWNLAKLWKSAGLVWCDESTGGESGDVVRARTSRIEYLCLTEAGVEDGYYLDTFDEALSALAEDVQSGKRSVPEVLALLSPSNISAAPRALSRVGDVELPRRPGSVQSARARAQTRSAVIDLSDDDDSVGPSRVHAEQGRPPQSIVREKVEGKDASGDASSSDRKRRPDDAPEELRALVGASQPRESAALTTRTSRLSSNSRPAPLLKLLPGGAGYLRGLVNHSF